MSTERILTDGVDINVGTTDGGLIADPAGSVKPDPPACWKIFGAIRHMFDPTTNLCIWFIMR